jgi:hypothetical protein
MKKAIWFLFLFAALGLTFNACTKDENDVTVTETFTEDSEDVALAFDFSEDVEEEIDMTMEELGLGISIRSACPTVTVTPDRNTFPRTIVIDYGTDGCKGRGGRTRTGKILIVQSDSMNVPGATRTVTLENFTVDSAKVEGMRTITYKGRNDKGYPYFTWQLANGKITYPNGKSVTWSNDYTRTQITGFNTKIHLDDVFVITGSGKGVNRNGNAFTKTITEPLVRNANCRWFERGAIQITVNNKTWTIDYDNGPGLCDPIATVTLPNGEQKTIYARPWWKRG